MKSLTFLFVGLFSLSAVALPPRIKVLKMEVAPGTYTKNQHVDYFATIAGDVTVKGTPRIFINVGPMLRSADYISGSGTSVLQFRYVVQPGDYDLDGIEDYGMIKGDGAIISVEHNNTIETVYPSPYQRKKVFVDARISNPFAP